MTDRTISDAGDQPAEAGYDLADWSHDLRAELAARLAEQGLGHRWEGDEVVVADADAEAAEALIDELEPEPGTAAADAEPDVGDEDGGGGILSLLYVAADVLGHDPADNGAVLDILGAVEAGRPAAPYGLDIAEWETIWARAERLAELLGDGEDDQVRESAGHLREAVRDLV